MIKNTKNKVMAEILLIFVAAAWGIGFPVMKLAINENPILIVLWLRFFLAAILLFPFCYVKLNQLSVKSIFVGCTLGLFLGASFIFLITGLQFTTATNTGFLAGLAVIWVLLLSGPLAGKLPSTEAIIATLFGVAGLYLMSGFESATIQYGDILVIIGSIFTALHIIGVDKFSAKYDNTILLFFQFITITVLIGILLLIQGGSLLPIIWSNNLIIALTITVIFSTILAFWIQTAFQRYTTPTRAVLIYNLEPVFSALFAVWLLNETIAENIFWGGCLIVIGMSYPSFIARKSKNHCDHHNQ